MKHDEIKCPGCGAVYEDYEYSLVSYHGSESGPHVVDCGECGHTFMLNEIVDRSYEVVPNESVVDG